MFWDHFFKHLLQLVSVGGGSEVIGMMHGTNDEFLFHSDSKNGITVFEFFIPSVVWIGIRKFEVVLDAVASSKDDRAHPPVHTRIMAFEPVVPEVYVFLPKIGDCEVDALMVFANCQTEFNEFCDIPALVAGPVSIVDQNGYYSLLRVDLMFEYVGTIDCAAHTAAV